MRVNAADTDLLPGLALSGRDAAGGVVVGIGATAELEGAGLGVAATDGEESRAPGDGADEQAAAASSASVDATWMRCSMGA